LKQAFYVYKRPTRKRFPVCIRDISLYIFDENTYIRDHTADGIGGTASAMHKLVAADYKRQTYPVCSGMGCAFRLHLL